MGEQIPVLDNTDPLLTPLVLNNTDPLLTPPVLNMNPSLNPPANNGPIMAINDVPDLPNVPDLSDVTINNPIPEPHQSN